MGEVHWLHTTCGEHTHGGCHAQVATMTNKLLRARADDVKAGWTVCRDAIGVAGERHGCPVQLTKLPHPTDKNASLRPLWTGLLTVAAPWNRGGAAARPGDSSAAKPAHIVALCDDKKMWSWAAPDAVR
jgi:hypothetical protein